MKYIKQRIALLKILPLLLLLFSQSKLIAQAPQITQAPVGQTVSEGQSTQFTVGASGTNLVYRWMKDGSPLNDDGRIGGAATTTLNIGSTLQSDAGSYSVVVSVSGFPDLKVSSEGVLLKVTPVMPLAPQITQQPSNQTTLEGHSVQFNLIASGTNLVYQWTKDGVPLVDGGRISGVGIATLSISGVLLTDMGGYSVVVSVAGYPELKTSSDVALLKVNVAQPIAPLITQQPLEQVASLGSNVQFTVSATGTNMVYKWAKDGLELSDGGRLSGATTPVLTITGAQSTDEGSYSVIVTRSDFPGLWTGSDGALLTLARPEIAIEQPVGTNIADSESKDFGQVSVGSNNSFTFTIKNTGPANLTGLTVTKDGTNASDFTITSNPVAPVSGPSGTTTFTVQFTPSAAGARSAAIHIASNDADENPFDINLSGTGVVVAAPEIAIEQPVGTNIADSGSKDFGQVSVGSNNSFTFTIKNTGPANLTGLTVTKDGTNASDFTITSNPVAPVSGPSGTTTFTVQFTPSAAGARSAAIHIASNDADENPFDINLSGTGVVVAAPEIAIEQPVGTNIADSGSKDFGQVSVGSNNSFTFTIKNTGTANLTDLVITKDGTNASDFTIASNPATPVGGPSGSTTFTVQFTPSAAGARSAAIHVGNNDADENPFDIILSGTGVIVAAAEIAVEQPVGTNLPDGGSKDFGQVSVGSNASLTFTIKNTGNADLTVLTLIKDGANAADFTITYNPVAPVGGPSGSTTFTVQFTPSAAGARSASLQIASNDENENPFDITLSGTGVIPPAPEIVVEEPVGMNLADGTTTLAFGNSNIGTPITKTVTVRNAGTANLTGLSVTRSGANASDFAVNALSSTSLPPGASTSFTVTFNPTAAGSRNASFQIASNDANENPFDIALGGTGVVPPSPEIVVEEPVGMNLADGAATQAFGNSNIGTPITKTVTVRNTGTANLTGLAVTRSGTNASDFALGALGLTTLAPGVITTFTVTFTPTAAGSRSASLQIASNDENENPFDIALGGTGVIPPAPEIVVEEPAGVNLADGTATLAFGNSNIGTPITKTITVRNTGTADLTGLAVMRSGTHASEFALGALGITTLSPGANTTFTVTFTPTAAGSRSASLQIASNDVNENPFDIALVGTGVVPPSPEIVVEEPVGMNLADGTATLAFGNSNIGTPITKTITVRNTGTAILTDLAVSRSSTNATDFALGALGLTTLAPGANTTFTVTFTPTAAGVRNAAIHIVSNDSDESPFDIALAGTGVAVPDIAVEQPGGLNLIDASGVTDLGSFNTGTVSPERIFTIRNTGIVNLTGLAITKDGANGTEFIVGSLATTTLAPGESTTLIVTFAPGAAGTRSAALHIASNDADENPFDIALSGTGIAVPEIAVEHPTGGNLTDSGSIIDFGNVNLGAAGPGKMITIRNTGTANLTGIQAIMDGAHGAEFTLNTSGMAASLEPGASTTFSVTFAPGAVGVRSAAIHIASNDADEDPFDINLAGTCLSNDPFRICFVGTPFEPRVGNRITFDLNRLTNVGETIKVVGKLPTGLKFNALTGLITGTLSGKPGTYQVSVQILQGKTVIRTVPFPITVLAFPSSLIGNFDCILEDTDSLPRGAFRLTITGANVWTATLESVGSAKKRSAKGSFVLAEGSPIAPITAVFPANSGTPAVTINLSIDGTDPTLAGSYDGGTVRGFRLASGAEVPPVAKNCNLVVDAGTQDGITTPAGIGWLKGSWGKTGIGTFKGMLGDGTAATIALRLSATGQAVLWAQPYTNKNSYIGGIVTLNNLGQPTNENEMLANGVWWSKGADAKTLSYPSGFPAMQVTLGVGKWYAPATASLLGASLGWRNDRMAAVTIDGAGLNNQDPQSTSSKLPTEFTLDDKYNLVVSAPAASMRVAWTGKAVKTDGSFTGTLTIPGGFSSTISSGTAAVSGVFLQDEPWERVTGCGLIKVPAIGVKGSFRTAAFVLEQ